MGVLLSSSIWEEETLIAVMKQHHFMFDEAKYSYSKQNGVIWLCHVGASS